MNIWNVFVKKIFNVMAIKLLLAGRKMIWGLVWKNISMCDWKNVNRQFFGWTWLSPLRN
jgi:hypothetical protein